MARQFVFLLLMVIAPAVAQAEWYERSDVIMGTDIFVKLWSDEEAAAASVIDRILDEMRRIDALMSTHKEESQLSGINRSAATRPVAADAELLALIERASRISEMTEGAFDITYASVGYLYDYRANHRPDADTVANNLQAIDYRLVQVDNQSGTVTFAHPNVKIDLGGIAKGYAVDRAIGILKQAGTRHAIVTAGGDTRVLGTHQARPWIVGIQDPRKQDDVVAVIPLANEAISTSGDYERYFDENGIRYHHIIDPDTGDSARSVHSASVIGPESTLADALSTSVFVLGLEKGMALIDDLEEYEAILVDAEGRLHYSAGLMQQIESQTTKDKAP